MSRSLFLAVLILAGTIHAHPVVAEDDFSRSGFYVGMGGMFALELFDDGGGLADIDNTGGLNVRAGYRILPWLAAEVLYEWAANFETSLNLPFPTRTVDVASHTIQANAKFVLPNWRAQPYLLVGIGAQGLDASAGGASASTWAFATRPAIGVDLYITENLVTNAEIAATVGTFENSTEVYMSFGGGLQYRF